MVRFRTKETEEKYKKLIDEGHLKGGCKLCQAPPIKEFNYWTIVKNQFPYDGIAKVHDMALPKRHILEDSLTREEQQEYLKIKAGYIEQTYEYIIEPASKLRSIPEHFHLHLIITKED